MTVDQVIRGAVNRLVPHYQQGEARAMVEMAIEKLKGWTRVDILTRGDAEVTPWLESEMTKITDRLLLDEPIQYILGEAQFHGLTLAVTPATLIPRPETAQLVDIVADMADDRSDLHVADIGTGSGAIAIALARTLRFAHVDAFDISTDALDVARKNAATLKVKVNFIHADILKAQLPADAYDIIVSNPPYVTESERPDMEPNVLLYEPSTALFVPDADPLRFYRRIATIGLTALKSGGLLAFEINRAYGKETVAMLDKLGYDDVELMRDSFGNDRFVTARK